MKNCLFFAATCLAAMVTACTKPANEEPTPGPGDDPQPQPEVVSVLSVRLDKEAVTLFEGETTTLVATVIPENADNRKVSWASDNQAVATVADGKVTAVAEGTAVVTVTTEDGAKTASCNVTVQPAGTKMEMTAPADISIDHTLGIYEPLVELTWTAVEGASGYVLKVSLSEDMSDAAEYELSSDPAATLCVKDFNHLAAVAGVKAGKGSVLHLQISDMEGTAAPANATMNFTTKFGSFEDPRDGEVYMTVEVGDFTWMCENLRATKYSDGEPLYDGVDAEPQLHSIVYEDGALGSKPGVYYSFGNVVRGFYGDMYPYVPDDLTSSIQLQGICPDGWHVTADDDWYYLLENACEITGEDMGNWLDRSQQWTVKSAAAINKLFSAKEMTFGTMENFPNDLGLYLIPGGRFDYPTSNVASGDPADYNFRAFYWSITMDSTGGYWSVTNPALTPSTEGDGSYYANRGDIHPTYGQSMSVRCVKNY